MSNKIWFFLGVLIVILYIVVPLLFPDEIICSTNIKIGPFSHERLEQKFNIQTLETSEIQHSLSLDLITSEPLNVEFEIKFIFQENYISFKHSDFDVLSPIDGRNKIIYYLKTIKDKDEQHLLESLFKNDHLTVRCTNVSSDVVVLFNFSYPFKNRNNTPLLIEINEVKKSCLSEECMKTDDSNCKPEERKSHNAIQKPCLSEECMKNIIKTDEENLEKIDVENVYLDNDSINSEYLLGYFYYRLLDEEYPRAGESKTDHKKRCDDKLKKDIGGRLGALYGWGVKNFAGAAYDSAQQQRLDKQKGASF